MDCSFSCVLLTRVFFFPFFYVDKSLDTRQTHRGGSPPGERACNVRPVIANQSCGVQTTVTEYANEEEEEFEIKISFRFDWIA